MKNKDLDWRIWNKNDLVEERTYSRATGKIPEMESAKQLRKILGNIHKDESVLDVGCASGHYLRSIRLINNDCIYTGVDATKKYIDNANIIHKSDTNARFIEGDIYSLKLKADIVFCCNVLLHLPDIKNVQQTTKKPILFTEFGYRSFDFSGEKPWITGNYEATPNLEAQTNTTKALFETFWKEDWFAGGFVWKWFHNYEQSGGAKDNMFTPQNKPAEDIIRQYYKK